MGLCAIPALPEGSGAEGRALRREPAGHGAGGGGEGGGGLYPCACARPAEAEGGWGKDRGAGAEEEEEEEEAAGHGGQRPLPRRHAGHGGLLGTGQGGISAAALPRLRPPTPPFSLPFPSPPAWKHELAAEVLLPAAAASSPPVRARREAGKEDGGRPAQPARLQFLFPDAR